MSDSVATVVIDFPATPRRVFQGPSRILTAHHHNEVKAVITAAEREAAAGSWVAGYVSYEAAPAFDAALAVRSGSRMPLAWFGVFDRVASDTPRALQPVAQPSWILSPAKQEFLDAVERIRAEIAAGRTYQVNLTARLTAELRGDPFSLYEQLRRAQGSGYHAYLDIGALTILSASPELFFEIRDRHIRTKPMKGTRARGRFTEEDARALSELAESEKDHAENLMIVDLLRNDLGRIARTGSVQVTSLYDIERYRTVHQMVSVIEADLADSVSLVDVFTALFPCGSVTGAPKVSTMQLITELEDSPREVYCGAIGILEPNGQATFSVPIRTLWLDRETHNATYGTGAGITFDSDARTEYEEINAKAAVLHEDWPEFELLETMRVEHGNVVRVERHLARLADSARYFGFSFDETGIRDLLGGLRDESGRLRLLLAADGKARIEVLPFSTPAHPQFALAGTPVLSTDRFLFHKTTHRRVYEQHQRADCFDVLLWNERGEVTEFTRGNAVFEIDGRRITPARECGLLAGTFRAELLETGAIHEGVVRIEDVKRATRIWFVNSLREWVELGPSAVEAIGLTL